MKLQSAINVEYNMDLMDVFLLVIYFTLAIFAGRYIVSAKGKHNPLYRKWFMKGLMFKLVGGTLFALVYTFYYTYGGDTRSYFRFGEVVDEFIVDHPTQAFDLLTRKQQDVSSECWDAEINAHYFAKSEYYVVNFTALVSFFTFHSYFSTTIVFAFLSFIGVWHMFLVFYKYYPKLERQMAFAVFFIPSVFFWGSGVMKDSLTIGLLGLLLYHVDRLISSRFTHLASIIYIALASYLIFSIKAYILVSFLPAVVLWRALFIRDKIKNTFIRALFLPVGLVIGTLGMAYVLSFLAEYNSRYTVNEFVDTAESMQGWHYKAGHNTSADDGRGSSYTLGAYDPTPIGLLKVFPRAVNVALYRPYFWEVKNAGMLAAAIESFLVLFFSIRILFLVNPFRVLRYAANDSFLMMCFVFSIFFAFAVGFSSYNFGALARYKIPCIPFYVAMLFILRAKVLEGKKNKNWKRAQKAPNRRLALSPTPR